MRGLATLILFLLVSSPDTTLYRYIAPEVPKPKIIVYFTSFPVVLPSLEGTTKHPSESHHARPIHDEFRITAIPRNPSLDHRTACHRFQRCSRICAIHSVAPRSRSIDSQHLVGGHAMRTANDKSLRLSLGQWFQKLKPTYSMPKTRSCALYLPLIGLASLQQSNGIKSG